MIDSGLFVGTLRHWRFRPIAHAFTYPRFMVLLDIDRVSEWMRVSAITSYNRWNFASFDEHDHLGDPGRPLRERLVVDATRHGIELPAGRIFLLTHLRYLGYCFNPVSFFYCLDRADRLQLVLAEASHTFGGRHDYWLRPDPASRRFRAAAAKSLDVSPFMPVDLQYAFAFTPPAGSLVPRIETQSGRFGWLRCDAVARASALERGRDPAGAGAISRDDGAGNGGDSLGGGSRDTRDNGHAFPPQFQAQRRDVVQRFAQGSRR